MKNVIRLTMFFALVSVLISCRDKAAEKRIAELESRLSQIEGNKSAASTTTPAAAEATPVVDEKPEGPLPVIEFEKIDHDFGTIKEGTKVQYTYKFKNTGQAPLIIQGAQGSCGCTTPDWTKEPIPVGGTGFIKAEFDSNGKPNIQNKTVTVTSNTWPKTNVLRFKAMVTPKADGANGPVK